MNSVVCKSDIFPRTLHAEMTSMNAETELLANLKSKNPADRMLAVMRWGNPPWRRGCLSRIWPKR